jgi:hypothetical protein
LLAEREQVRFALLKRQRPHPAHKGHIGRADFAAVRHQRILLGRRRVFLAATRDQNGEMIKPALRRGGVAQILQVVHGVIDHEANDSMPHILAPAQAIGDAADAGVD